MTRLLTFLVGAFVALWAVAFVVGSFLSSPVQQPVLIPNYLNAESVQVPSRSNAKLAGSWMEGQPTAPVILLLHGVRADRTSLFERAYFLKLLGYSVLMFDFQAHGESPGQRISFGHLEARDAEGAMDYIHARKPGARIGVIGMSMGGAAALLGTCAEQSQALVLESVYPDIQTAIDNRIRRWLGPFATLITPIFVQQLHMRLHVTDRDLRPMDRIARVKSPLLILSGEQDQHTTVEDTRRLYARANQPKALFLFPGVGHDDLYKADKANYESHVGDFLKQYL